MKRAVPKDFSYVKSDSSDTWIPAEAADSVAREKVCPMLLISRVSHLSTEDRERWSCIVGQLYTAVSGARIWRDYKNIVAETLTLLGRLHVRRHRAIYNECKLCLGRCLSEG